MSEKKPEKDRQHIDKKDASSDFAHSPLRLSAKRK